MKLDYQYFVIRFLETPCNSVPNYVYIPSKWIKNIICVENKVEVAYPALDWTITEELVKDDVNFDNDWKVWPAKLVCGCDSYSDAQKNLDTIVNQLYRQLRNNRLDEDTETLNDEDEEKNATGITTSATRETTISGPPHHAKSFRKRSLSLNSSCRIPRHKKSRTESTKAMINDAIVLVNADDTTKEKITPLKLSKINTSPKTEYVIINHNRSTNPVDASREQSPMSSTASETDNEYLENLCNDIIYIQDCAIKLFKNFESLSNSLLENRRSCKTICSILDDLGTLYDSDSISNSDS